MDIFINPINILKLCSERELFRNSVILSGLSFKTYYVGLDNLLSLGIIIPEYQARNFV